MTTYTYEYDDCGVLCRYSEEQGEWECCEPHCLNCGYPPEDCECETGFEEALYIKDNPNHPLTNAILKKTSIKQYTPKRTNRKKKKNSLAPTLDETKRSAKRTPKVKKIQLRNGWDDGVSCDDCYYKNNAETDEDSEDEENDNKH